MKLKTKMLSIFLLLSVLISVMSVFCFASNISLLNNNTAQTNTSFTISDTGIATVTFKYVGYPNITEGANITIKIEKRNFLFFWSDITEQTFVVSEESYYDVFKYQLSQTGTYKCTVTYTISGTGGSDDVITFEDTAKYS